MFNSVMRLSMTFFVFILCIAKTAKMLLQVALYEKHAEAKWKLEDFPKFFLFSQNCTVEYLVDAYVNSFSIKF